MAEKLSEKAFGYASGIVSAAGMLVLGVFANIGIYTGAAEMMGKWHMFFSLSALGIITGMIEAAVIGFVFAYAFARAYNKFA